MQHPPKPVEDAVVFDLTSIGQLMQLEDYYRQSGHMARTLVRTPHLRVVLMVMKANSRIPEHQASDTAAVHVISGHIRLHWPDHTVELRSGQLTALKAGLCHDVEAAEDSEFVLTLGWHAEDLPAAPPDPS